MLVSNYPIMDLFFNPLMTICAKTNLLMHTTEPLMCALFALSNLMTELHSVYTYVPTREKNRINAAIVLTVQLHLAI